MSNKQCPMCSLTVAALVSAEFGHRRMQPRVRRAGLADREWLRMAEAAYQFSGFSGLRTSFLSGMLCTLAVIGGRRAARRRGSRSFRWAEVRGLSFVDGSSPFAGSKCRRSSVVEQPPQGVLIPRRSLARRFACSERGWVAPSAPGCRSFGNKPCCELAARIT